MFFYSKYIINKFNILFMNISNRSFSIRITTHDKVWVKANSFWSYAIHYRILFAFSLSLMLYILSRPLWREGLHDSWTLHLSSHKQSNLLTNACFSSPFNVIRVLFINATASFYTLRYLKCEIESLFIFLMGTLLLFFSKPFILCKI